MAGRPRTPTNVLELRGAFKEHPKRAIERIFEPLCTDPIGDPPAGFDEDQLRAWNDFVTLAPKGVLTAADRVAVETASKLLALERKNIATDAQGRRLDNFLGKFAMTPSDRSKVSVPKEVQLNPFSKLG